jgi:hypothetical protein
MFCKYGDCHENGNVFSKSFSRGKIYLDEMCDERILGGFLDKGFGDGGWENLEIGTELLLPPSYTENQNDGCAIGSIE